MAVPALADWCAIDLFEEPDKITQIVIHHKNPKKIILAKKFRKMHPPDFNVNQGLVKVLKTGKSDFYPYIPQELILRLAKTAKELKIIKQLNLNSGMVVPLKITNRTIGAITFVSSESEHHFTRADLQIAEQLADMAARAIENANLYRVVDEEKSRLDEVVNHIPGIVWEARGSPKFKDYKMTFISGYIKKMLQISPSQIINSDGHLLLNLIHPDDAKSVLEEVSKIFNTGKSSTYSYRIKRKDGKFIWAESKTSAIQNVDKQPIGLRGVTIDITSRRVAEQSSSHMAEIIESTNDAVISRNLEGEIVSWNNGAEKLFGYKAEEVIGKVSDIIVPEEKKEELLSIIEIVKMGESIEGHNTVRLTKDKKLVDVMITVSPIRDSNGKVVGSSTIAKDLSSFKELERRKDSFISMTSHELKTPVTSLKAFTQLLEKQLQERGENELVYFTDKINKQLDRLTSLVEDLLDLSKIGLGKLALNKEKFSVDNAISQIIEDLQGISKKHKIIFEKKSHCNISADRFRIEQILINFITNAIKYSPSSDRVIVKAEKIDGSVKISVRDFGIGIDEKYQEKIFDRFFRVEGSNEKTFPGLGVGLHISSEIARRHGGFIGVSSKKGEGSEFYVSLPLK